MAAVSYTAPRLGSSLRFKYMLSIEGRGSFPFKVVNRYFGLVRLRSIGLSMHGRMSEVTSESKMQEIRASYLMIGKWSRSLVHRAASLRLL
jgi:hypothetical protein